MSDRPKKHLFKAADIEAARETFHHPWNPSSEITGTALGRTLGLERVGVNLGRIPPGKESFIYHSHESEEEWIYILSGRAVAEIDGEEHEVGAGDFMAFPTPSVAHHLRNPFPEPLVYLFGGESKALEVADFPKLGKRMVRTGEKITIYDLAAGKPFG